MAVHDLVSGRRGKCHPRVARAVLGVRVTVTTVGLERRMRALAALGWPRDVIAGRAGVSGGLVSRLQLGQTPRPRLSTVAKLLRAYAELSMTPGPSAWTRTYARGRGWMPPLAWDDDAIDDPKARSCASVRRAGGDVDPGVVERLCSGDPPEHVTPAERAEAARRLVELGWSSRRVAEHLGVTARSVDRYRAA